MRDPNEALVETYTRLVNQHDLTFDFSDDARARMRGARELHEIERMKRTLGPAYAARCRDIWDANIDRKFSNPVDRNNYYWKERGTLDGGPRFDNREATQAELHRVERKSRFWESAYESAGSLWEYVMGALWDGYRRCLDEGWFGKTTYDWMTERHYKTNQSEKFQPIYSGPDWEAKREAAREAVLQRHCGEEQQSRGFECDRATFQDEGRGI